VRAIDLAARFQNLGELNVLRRQVGYALAIACCAAATAHAATPASETVFPKTTKGYISTANLDELEASWRKTQIGQLMADPIMKPFEDDFAKVPSGEASVAAIEPTKGDHAQAVYADVTGREDKAAELIEIVAKTMAQRHAKRSAKTIKGVSVTLFDVPKQGDIPAYSAGYFVHDHVLVGVDNLLILEGMVGRLGHESDDSLAGVMAFKTIMQRCKQAAGDARQHLRWFIEPFGYADLTRAANSERRKRQHDLLEILRHQGFTAVQGLGGFVALADGQHELLHRTLIYAPPVAGAGDSRYTLAARMLNFPNGGKFDPPTWAPREVATFACFNLKTKEAFEASKTLINEYVGDEVFEDVLAGIRDDPNGPHVDVRKELIAHLGQRVVMLSDYHLPITTKSERILLAVETENSAVVARTIERMMKVDPNARRREFNNHVIWEMVEEEAPLPMVIIENQPEFAEIAVKPADEDEKDKTRLPPNSAVSVANGQLLWATNIDLIIKILAQPQEQETLGGSVDLKLVQDELKKFAATENSAMTFSRTDEEYRSVYELFRQGRMPESETMFGKLLNLVLGDNNKSNVPREQRFDGSKLPDFEAVRRYFGPAGVTINTEDDGWFLTGFTLNKQPPETPVGETK